MENKKVKKQVRKTKGAKGKIVPLHTKRKEAEKAAPTVGAGLAEPKRKTGIDILGDAGWGTHFCLFYHTKQDLIDILAPYFKAGLENNEFCMWVTSEPLNSEDAKRSLKREVKDLDGYIKKGQIEILDYSDWYTKTGEFEADRVLQGWVDKHDQAIKNGFDGLRLTGNTFWLEKKDWRKFTDYEAVVNSVIGKYKMLAVCTYSIERCGASEILDVEHNHQFSLLKWKGDWKILESSDRNQMEARLAEQTMISEALEHSKKEWVETFNAISDWVVMVDLDGRILRTNIIGEEFTGVPLDEIIDQSCCRLVHGSEKHIPGCPLLKMLETGQQESQELQVPDTDQWLMVTVDPVTDEEGKIIGAVHITRDITERKRAEEQLRRSEKQASTAIEAARGFTFNYDIATGKVNWGGAIEEITGYTPEGFAEVDVDGWAERIHPDDKDRVLSILQEAIDQEDRATAEYRFKTKKGYVTLSSISLTERENGKAVRLVGILQDITERKQAEERIYFLAEIVKSSPLSVITTDKNARIAYVNPTTEKLFGYKAEELIGKDPGILNAEPDPVKSQKEMLDSIAQKNYWKGEVLNRKKNGEVFHLGASVFRLHDEKGNFVAMVGFQEDITERKQAEEKLRENERFLKDIFDAIQDGVSVLDRDYNIVRVNPWMEKLCADKLPLVGKKCYSAYQNRDSVCPWCPCIRAVETGEAQTGVVPSPRADKSTGWVELTAFPLKDTHGRVKGIIEHVKDITERKRVEEALRENEERYRSIFEQAADAIVLIDAETGEFTVFNDKAYENLGYTREEFRKLKIPNFEIIESAEEVTEHIEKIIREGADIFETKHRRKDGQIRDIVVSSRAITIGGKHFVQSIWRDITERKRAEEALRVERDNFINILDSMVDGVYIVDQNHNIQYVNPVLKKDFGSFEGRKCYEYFHDREEACPWCKNKQVFAGKTVRWEWYSFKNQRTYDLIDTPLRNPDGSISKLEIFRDITERKKAEEALRKSEQGYRQLVDTAQEGIWIVDAEAKTSYTNQRMAEMLGYGPEEMLSRTLFDFMDEEATVEAKRNFERREKGIREQHDFRFRRKDGSDLWTIVTTNPILDNNGQFIGALGMITDITERKQAEGALQESEKRFRLLVEGVTDYAIFMLDPDGHVVSWNTGAERIKGYQAKEIIGRHFSCFYPAEDVEQGKPEQALKVVTAKGRFEEEGWRVRKDGSQFWANVLITALRDESGHLQGFSKVTRDITKRKKAEEEIAKLAKFPSENPNPVLRISSNGLILYNNKAALPLLKAWGCRRKDQLLSGRWYQYVADALGCGGDQQAEVKCGERIFSLTFAPVVDSNYVNVYALDITKRKQAEEKLLEDKKQLRSLASELSLTEERERRHIAEGLHDSIIQPLVFLDIKLDSLKKSAKQRGLIDSLDKMRTTIGELIEMTRGFTFDLSSSVVYELGLEAAIEEWLTTNIREKYAIATIFEDDGQSKPLDDDMRAFLFKAVRELLINVVKHAGAGSVKVSAARDEDKIKICVEDDGAGFDYLKKKAGLSNSSGYGLFSIRERLRYLGGSFDIESKLGHGTRVALTAPLKCDS